MRFPIKSRHFMFVVLLTIIVAIGAFLPQNASLIKTEARAQSLRQSNEPSFVVIGFLHALIENDIKFAKELIVPQQQTRIEKWKTESQHKVLKCPYIWRWILSDPFQTISWGGTGASEIDSNTREVDSTFGCNNNNFLMSVENVILEFNGIEWIITDWEMICETPASGGGETCYL